MSAFNDCFSTTVQIHKGEYPLSFQDLCIPEGSKFGIVINNVVECEMDSTPVLLCFTIDNSGSMNESGGRASKLEYVKQTAKNILRFIQGKPVYIQINIFDNKYKQIVELTPVTEENIEKLLRHVDEIFADAGTNIGYAIGESQRIIDSYSDRFSKIHHFFLTDGLPTEGIVKNQNLIDLVTSKYPTAFIGYGIDHNVELLVGCAKRHSCSVYQLVDNFETIGNLCGELLHAILYPVLKDVLIILPSESDKIYNAKTNEWSNKIQYGSFISGKEYRTPVYTSENSPVIINTTGIRIDNGEIIDTDILQDGNCVDLTKDIFRHAVNLTVFGAMENEFNIRQKARNLFKKIHKYAREHSLLDETFYKLLLEDLYTIYNKQNMNGNMHIISRHYGNSNNQTFRSSSTHEREPKQDPNCGLQRMASVTQPYDEEYYVDEEEQKEYQNEYQNEYQYEYQYEYQNEDQDDILNYNPENIQSDASQSLCEIMRAVS